jgi:colanic acid/amylovoran biosynthesis glycosyltransferase
VKLAYLISRYPAISHTFILREVAELRRQGFEILIASINPPDRPESGLTAEERGDARETFYVKAAGIPGALSALARTLVTHLLGVIRGLHLALRLGGTDLRRLAKSLAYLVEGLMIGQWMARHQVSHLHVHFATPAAAVGLMTQAVFGTGFSFTVHGPDEFYDAPGQGLTAKIEGADFVVCISHYACSQMMKLSGVAHWDKFEVCRLGVDPETFMPVERIAEPGPFRLVCVGRLVPAKGQHILLKALHRLAESGRFPHLELVGDGPDRSSLETEAGRLGLSSQVHFAGAVNQDAIRRFYANADAFVLPSFAEGLPVVLMEAMAMGIPCITTSITGVPELIENGESGLLVPASDVDGLAAAIIRLMDDPALCQRLSERGRERVLADYVLRVNSGRLGEIFRARLS